ncbi:MAG: hypothetical protein RBT71_00530 [Flavobacteriales bacterium]|jgi:hypothetical protein|nr:hypothetical protein [Flavobacteriales bacterium]
MRPKPIPLRDYIKYLQRKGLVGYGRKSGSHERFDYPEAERKLMRPVTVDHHHAEVPSLHLQTGLMTLGITYEQFLDELVEFGIVKRKGNKRRK